MLIVLLARTLCLPAGVIGLLMAAGAAGGLLGAFAARPLARLVGEGPVTWISLAAASPCWSQPSGRAWRSCGSSSRRCVTVRVSGG